MLVLISVSLIILLPALHIYGFHLVWGELYKEDRRRKRKADLENSHE